jgi:hypothetical protein
VLDVLADTVAHRWTGRTLARAFHQAGCGTSSPNRSPSRCRPGFTAGSSGRPWPPRSRRGHSRLTPTSTGWGRRRTPSAAAITATRSSGWPSQPASLNRPARDTARGSLAQRMIVRTHPRAWG